MTTIDDNEHNEENQTDDTGEDTTVGKESADSVTGSKPRRLKVRWLTNKYAITLVIFIVLLVFFDANNFISRYRIVRELRQMELQKEYYQQEIELNERISDQLTHDLKEVETYGRERYLMKRADEDIFLIIDESERPVLQ